MFDLFRRSAINRVVNYACAPDTHASKLPPMIAPGVAMVEGNMAATGATHACVPLNAPARAINRLRVG